jgi:hypothetical protein
MFLEPGLRADIPKSVLHWHTIRADHAECVDVDDVNMVEGLYKVGARDDLAGFVEWDLGKRELVQVIGGEAGRFADNEGPGENYGCGLVVQY